MTSFVGHTLSTIKDVKRKSPTIARSTNSTLYCVTVSIRAPMCSKTIGLVALVNPERYQASHEKDRP